MTNKKNNIILGLEEGTVALFDYNEEWQKCFEKEKELVNSALADIVLQIEHIGSTSVPGLPAKPIIDLAVRCRKPRFFKGLYCPS